MTTRATRGPRRRTVVALAVILAVLSAFVVRLVDIQVVSANEHIDDSLHVGELGYTETLYGDRGSIVDEGGETLASSVKVYDVQLSPSLIMQLENDPDRPPKMPWDEAADKIAAIIGQDADELRAAVADNLEEDPSSQYYQLAKGLSTEEYLELRDLGLVYIAAKARETRVYPNGAVAGNVVGYVDNAGEGQAGIERMESACLAPENGERTYLRGKNGIVIPGSERTVDAVSGGSVQLTINSDLQWYLQQMIAEEAQKQGAKAGTVTVVEVDTGKIRAAAEWPSLDPNDLNASSPEDWGTRVFGTTFRAGVDVQGRHSIGGARFGCGRYEDDGLRRGERDVPQRRGDQRRFPARGVSIHSRRCAHRLLERRRLEVRHDGRLADPIRLHAEVRRGQQDHRFPPGRGRGHTCTR